MDLTALTSLLGLLDLLPEPAHTPAWAFKRGRVLRRVLDDLRPVDGGVR